MNPFDSKIRHHKIIELDYKTDHGKNCAPYKRDFMDVNSIDLSLDDTIYRIFSLDKFMQTLKNKTLCLVRPYKWDDPFENFLLNSEGQLEDGRMVGFENIRDRFYGQCWTLKKECDGLWRNYKGKQPAAIKVKTKVGKLMDQFYDLSHKFHELTYFIGKVEYVTDDEIIDYFKNEVDIMHFQSGVEFAQTLLIKRKSFAYEEEVRIIFSKPSTNEIELTTVKNPWDDTDRFFVNIDINTLFEEIEIDPWLPKAEYDKLKQDIIDLGFTGTITRSSLYNKPFFVTKIKR